MNLIGLSHGRPTFRRLISFATVFALIVTQASLFPAMSSDEETSSTPVGSQVQAGTCGQSSFDAARSAKIADLPIVERTVPTARDGMKSRPPQRRIPGQDSGQSLKPAGAISTDIDTSGRWLEGYRPNTPKAWREFEAWKADQRRARGEVGVMIPSAPGDVEAIEGQVATGSGSVEEEEIQHFVREDAAEATVIDIGELPDLPEGLKSRGTPSDYHHSSGLTLEEYVQAKENAAHFTPETLGGQEAVESMIDAPTGPNVAFNALNAISPAQGIQVPPDPIMAAGPGHLIGIVNSKFRVWDKTGTPLIPETTLDSFFSGVPNCGGSFDVFVDYDEANDRFVMGSMALFGDDSYLCLAATKTGDPTTQWNTFSYRADGIDTSVSIDNPNMGIGLDAVYVSGTMFADGGGFSHVRLYAFDKDDLYNGTPLTAAEANVGGSYFGARVAKLHGYTSGGWPAPGTPHHIVARGVTSLTLGDMRIWRWVNPFTQSPTIYGTLGTVFLGIPPLAPENGDLASSTNLNDTGDGKWWDAEYRGGFLWGVRNVACNFGGGDAESCLDWIRVDVSGVSPVLVEQQTGAAYGTTNQFRYYPDGSVDKNFNYAVGYTRSGWTDYAEVYVTGRLFGDTAGTLQPEVLQKSTTEVYTDGLGCGGTCDRWGDYTGMTIDPDGCTFWYLGQYALSGTFDGQWGTHIGSFQFSDCSVDSSMQLNKGTYSCDDSVTITVSDATPIDAATVAASTTITSGSDSESPAASAWVGSNCIGTSCSTWTTSLAVSGDTGSSGDGTLNVVNGAAIQSDYTDPHPTHDDQSRQATASCETRFDDGGFLLFGGCEDGTGTEAYRDYIDAGENVQYTFGLFNPPSGPSLTDVQATLSITGAAATAGLITIHNPTVHIGSMAPESLSGATFTISVDPAADAPAYRLSLHDFNLSVTSVADGYTSPQVLTQQQYIQGDDNIITENECYNFETAQGWQQDTYVDAYTCGIAQGCTPPADMFSTSAQWTKGTGCLSETRTDVPDPFDCDTGGTTAWMSNGTAGSCTNFTQTATTYTDDVIFSPIFTPANTGNAGNGQPWFYQWLYSEWFYNSDMETAPGSGAPAIGWAHFWSSDYDGVSTPATNETDTLYDLALGFVYYPNQAWDSGTAWDPSTGAVNYDGAAFPDTITGQATSGLQWRWAIRVRDVDAFGQARPTTTAATTGVAYDNLNLVYDQYHAEEQVGVCAAGDAPGVVALDQFSYTECGSGTMGVSVTDSNAPGSSVTVTLTSRGTGDSETFTISGTAPYFGTTFDYDTAGGTGDDDGVLYVTPQDTVDASYEDTDPVGTATAFAFIDCSEGSIIASVNLIQDDGNGDGDEYPDTNEVMELSVSLRNSGATDLTNVKAYLFSNDTQIDCITKNMASYGTIAADTAVSNDIGSDPFVFSVASTTVCTDPDNPPRTTFNVLITADGVDGSSSPQTLSFVLDVNLSGADGGQEVFAGYASPVSEGSASGSTIEMATRGKPDTFTDGGIDVAVCGNAQYDDGDPETSSWFNGGQAGNPDCILAELFEPGDFSILAAYEISSICFGNELDWGGPWPNRWRIHPDNGGVPDDTVTLAEGVLTTGDGTGQDEQAINPPVQMGAGDSFWVLIRGDAGCCDGQDFNVDLDQSTSTGHRYGNACDGLTGLAQAADSEFVIHTTLAETASFVCDTTVRPDPEVCGLVVDDVGNLTEFCGDGDMNVEPTEIWDVDVTLKKQGAGDAVSAAADLAVNVGSAVAATISGNPGDYGTIAASGGTATDTYRFTVDVAAACINDLTFDVTNISDTSTTYPDETSAFQVPVGATVAVETGNQQTSPAVATNNTGSAIFTPAFSLASAASASVSYSTAYSADPDETATQDTDPLTVNNTTSVSTLSAAFTIDDLTAQSATVDWTSLTHGGNVNGCTTVFLRTPNATDIDLKADGAAPANPYDVLSIYQGVNGGPGQYSIGLVEDSGGSGCNSGPAELTGVTMVVAGTSSANFTDNARVELYDGTTAHLLKDYGVADANPYDVTSIYNGAGPGTYEIRVSENNAGGTAEVSSAALSISAVGCDLGCTALPGPPPVGDGISGNQMLVGKGVGVDDVDITFDVATCSSDHAVVLYGDMGDFSAYQGEVTTGCDAGSTGTATINQSGSFWFNVIWVNGSDAAGYPGEATAGPRTWTATGLCSVASDDQGDQVCN